MAVVTLNTNSNITSIPRHYLLVEVKQNWADGWTVAPYLWPTNIEHRSCPQISELDFYCDYGYIGREGQTTRTWEVERKYEDWYVRVRSQMEGGPLLTIFVGIISHEWSEPDRRDVRSGTQYWKAFGLEHLLAKKPLNKTVVVNYISRVVAGNVEIVEDIQEIDRVPRFNDVDAKEGEDLANAEKNRSKFRYKWEYNNDPLVRDWGWVKNEDSDPSEEEPSREGIYLFDESGYSDTYTWHREDILEHVLYLYALWIRPPKGSPFFAEGTGIKIDLAGQIRQDVIVQSSPRIIEFKGGVLESVVDAGDFVVDGSVWDLISSVCSRRFGVHCFIDPGDGDHPRDALGNKIEDGKLKLTLRSWADREITGKYGTLPANNLQRFYVIPSSPSDLQHATSDVKVQYSRVNSYEKIIIQGNPYRITGTWSVTIGPLNAASRHELNRYTGLDVQYFAGSGNGTDAALNDAYRNSEFFARVLEYQVPWDWDWKLTKRFRVPGAVQGQFTVDEKTLYPCRPLAQDDGSTRWGIVNEVDSLGRVREAGGDTGAYWTQGTRFRRTTDLLDNVLYDQQWKVPQNATDPVQQKKPPFTQTLGPNGQINVTYSTKPEYIDAFLTFEIPNSPQPAPNQNANQYAFGHHLGAEPWNIDPVYMTFNDDKFAFTVHCANRHMTLLNTFVGAKPTLSDPEIDDNTMHLTATVECGERPRYVIDTTLGQETTRTKIFNVNASVAFLAEGTVVDIDENGAELYSHIDNEILIDESWMLQDIGAFVEWWNSIKRQSATIPMEGLIGLFTPLGTLVPFITGGLFLEPVNTIVTGRSIQFGRGPNAIPATVVSTGQIELEDALALHELMM